MEKNEILHKADELRVVSLRKQVTYEKVIEQINYNANNGMSFFNTPELPEGIIYKLIQNGFSISSFEDQMKITFNKITW